MNEVGIWSEYITLGQLIKMLNYVGSGAEVKGYLSEHSCNINNEPDNRRGRKIRPGDVVEMPDGRIINIVVKAKSPVTPETLNQPQ